MIWMAFLFVYVGLVLYIGWSGWGWMKPRVSARVAGRVKFLYSLTLVIVATSFILGRMFDNVILKYIGSYWMALFYLLVILLPPAHLSAWLIRLTRIPRHYIEKWSGFIILLLLISLIAYGSFNAYSPTIQNYDVHIKKNVNRFQPLNIVMASDMHFGLLSGKEHAKRMVTEINALHPDIVLFPGDIVDDEIEQFVKQGIDQIISQIDAPYGVFASLGNHDKYKGSMEELIHTLERGNMKVLYDESVMIDDQFILMGRKDRSDSKRLALPSLMNGLDLAKPIILLDHQPRELDVAQRNGIDLMVSGHTHRGQVFPGNLITDRIYENNWGHLQKEQFHSIVSSGFGFWGPPLRLGSRSEIVKINVFFDGDLPK